MSLLQKSLKGAVLGASIGATVSVTYHMMSPGKCTDEKSKEKEIKYQYIFAHADVNYIISELKIFNQIDKETKNAFTVLCDSLDRLLALETVTNNATKDNTKPSWPVTAHHYKQEIFDAVELIRTKIKKQQQKVVFDMQTEELKQQILNSLYNIDMNVQHVLGRSS